MRRLLVVFSMLTLLMFMIGACAPAAAPTETSVDEELVESTDSTSSEEVITEPIKVGVLAPLTGPIPQFGKYMRDGFELALEEVNAEGGINGRPIELIYEDTECIDLKAVQSGLKKLHESDQVPAILGPFCGSPSAIAAQFSKDNKAFIVSPGDNFGVAHKPYMMSTRYLLAKEANLMAQLAIDMDAPKIGILYFNNDWGIKYRDAVIAHAEANGGDVVATEGYDFSDLDVRTQLLKIEAEGAESLIMIDGTAGDIFEQIVELGLNFLVISEWEIETTIFEGRHNVGLDGAYYFSPLPDEFPLKEKFVAKYDIRPNVLNIDSYDAFYVMVDALRACPDFDEDCLIGKATDLQDYQKGGYVLTFDKEAWSIDKPFILKQVQDGEIVVVGEEEY